MFLKINSEITDLSGGCAYVFAIYDEITNETEFISGTLHAITTDEWDYVSYTNKMSPDILPYNVPTEVSIDLHTALGIDKTSSRSLDAVEKVNVYIYARDVRGNHNITPFRSNPVYIQ